MEGKTCTDFRKRLEMLAAFKVTEKHIKEGVRKDPCHCPVANALRDCGFENVRVFPTGLECDGDVVPVQGNLTEKIRHFDETGEMEPVEVSTVAYRPAWEPAPTAPAPTELKR